MRTLITMVLTAALAVTATVIAIRFWPDNPVTGRIDRTAVDAAERLVTVAPPKVAEKIAQHLPADDSAASLFGDAPLPEPQGPVADPVATATVPPPTAPGTVPDAAPATAPASATPPAVATTPAPADDQRPDFDKINQRLIDAAAALDRLNAKLIERAGKVSNTAATTP